MNGEWDSKSINKFIKGERFYVDTDDVRGHFTIKYCSIKCDNAIDIILDDDFGLRSWGSDWDQRNYKPIRDRLRYTSKIFLNRQIRRAAERVLWKHFKIIGFGMYYNPQLDSRYRVYFRNFKVRKIQWGLGIRP